MTVERDEAIQLFRGICFGLLFALPMWAGIYLLLWLIIR